MEHLDRQERFDAKMYKPRVGYMNNDYLSVLNHTSTSALTVIVTDLFQSDNDFAGVASDVQSKYFSSERNGNAIAIVGDKLPFKGPIFDIGLPRQGITYEGERPIYAMVLGAEDQVLALTDRLKAKFAKHGVVNENISIFSSEIVSCLSPIDVPLAGPLAPALSAANPALYVDRMDGVDELMEGSSPFVKQFSIREDPATFTLDVPITPLPLRDPLRADSLTIRYDSEKATDAARGAGEKDKLTATPLFQTAPEAQDAISFQPIALAGACGTPCMLRLTGSLQPRSLTPGDVYR
ncbi:MAG: hypothetical protein JO051_00335, partial [Acidobacteriaceae bacterium]|nr:hypothetical protein [Acidobacteriaceae bacterium]